MIVKNVEFVGVEMSKDLRNIVSYDNDDEGLERVVLTHSRESLKMMVKLVDNFFWKLNHKEQMNEK